jgi:hypothetical protein
MKTAFEILLLSWAFVLVLVPAVGILVYILDRRKRPEDGHTRAAEREARWYPLR